MTDRFDPVPDVPHGTCRDCDVTTATNEDTSRHLRDSGHAMWITNPDRERRIRSAVNRVVTYAIDGALEDLWPLLDMGATEDEIAEALHWYSDFSEAWQEARDE